MAKTRPYAFAVATLLAGAAVGQTVPTGFAVDTLLATGLPMPHDCCFLPDGRCLVANGAGEVVLYAGGGPVAIGTVPNVESGGERGLLSIAADPAFAANGQIYVWYSSTLDQNLHLDRFTCTGSLADPTGTNLAFTAASRHVLLGDVLDLYNNHNGGSLRFGPDGMLYVSIGDDLASCAAQSVTSQLGCLLRLDVRTRPAGGSLVLPSYSALDPGDNPLSAATDFRQLVLAHGLRNPFRMEIDPVTGNIYIGDVGESGVEEYSEYVYPSGPLPLVNFGWPWREGDQPGFGCSGAPPVGLVEPIAAVPHSSYWAAIMGGARYRNLGGMNDFGPAYEESAFFLDFYNGEVRRIEQNGGVWAPAAPVPGQPTAVEWATGMAMVTSLRLGPDGALWFTQRSGALRRVRPLGVPNSTVALGGDGQYAAAGDQFDLPLTVRVFDGQGNPRQNAAVTFTAHGAGAPTMATVSTDGNGVARAFVQALAAGGPIEVAATAVGAGAAARFHLFARRLSVSHSAAQLTIAIENASPVARTRVPYALLMSFPGVPVVPTPLGPICTDPTSPLTFVLEDSIGLLGGWTLSGTGMVGLPGITKTYPLPPGLLSGQRMSFQAFGADRTLGLFRTNCEPHQF